mmetsp:Transcript_11709/g.14594  ORF Transcript_11709/g.14594 Transcript_11709/m.14594 type:complete len:83 (-) Transcript_11709:217-465(-)
MYLYIYNLPVFNIRPSTSSPEFILEKFMYQVLMIISLLLLSSQAWTLAQHVSAIEGTGQQEIRQQGFLQLVVSPKMMKAGRI